MAKHNMNNHLEMLHDLGEEELKLLQWYFQTSDEPSQVTLKETSAVKASLASAGSELDKIRDEFVERVTTAILKQVIDALESDGVFNNLEKEAILEENLTRADKARSCIDSVMKKGNKACRKMIQHLHTKDPTLSSHLGLSFVQLAYKEVLPICQSQLKKKLKEKFECVFEGIAKAGNPAFLNQIYTQLDITEGNTVKTYDEHEVLQIQSLPRKMSRPEKTIQLEEIFKTPPGRTPIRTVITKGVAGIGKTVLTQKFTLDWAENKTNQELEFIFPFTFKELNVLKEKKFSLVGLVHKFFKETKEMEISSFENFQVLFIFDGLDECRLPLDFSNNEILTDVTESNSVDVLLTNLINGNLLQCAHLWITTRPAAANRIPAECIGTVTEVRGFTDPQKEEYFRRRFKYEEQANRIISHIKKSRALHIMCHIPVFCWITATVLEDELKLSHGQDLPKSLTEMYIHFLVVQAKVKKIKYDGGAVTDPHWTPESRKMIESLGKLAFEQLQKGNLIFYESDLIDCGIDVRVASVYSGVFTQIFREERGLYQDKVFRFIHLSVQEFLAALYVHLTFINSGVNLMNEKISKDNKTRDLNDLNLWAVYNALRSPNGHLDLFLRFLLGLSLQSNQGFLRDLLTQRSELQTNHKTLEYIKKMITEHLSVEKSINLFHCLNELNDCSLVEEIQQSLNSGSLSIEKLSPAQWSALVFILLSSQEDLDVFDLKKFSASEEVLLRLLPVVKASNKALLSICILKEGSCEALSSVLTSQSCELKELELRIDDSGVKPLLNGLQSANCNLESLRLSVINISDGNVAALSSLISSQAFSLKELDLSNNSLQSSGIELISMEIISPLCQLETLRLRVCNLSERSCEVLSSVLGFQSCILKEMDLSNNNLQDFGVKLLSAWLGSPQCQLEILRLSGCLVAEESCIFLASALSSNPCHLREMDLSYNHPGDLGVQLLSAGVEDPNWKLEMLSVEPAGIRWLTPGLRKYSLELTINTNTVNKELSLSDNKKNVTRIWEAQSYPDHPERFDVYPQLLCMHSLNGRCYWEVVWKGDVHLSVSYKGINRKGCGNDCLFGGNNQSWSLICSDVNGYSVWHNNKGTSISSSVSNRVAMYVDCPAGILSFYKVSSDTLMHLHTFNIIFTEPLYPGFTVLFPGSSVFLCQE